MNYYNEFDPFAAAWLRELIKENLIPQGTVDERSIVDVRPEELREFTQCHFFAGIGGWSYALQLAGWPEDRPVWTGSCPCQPFSSAGNQKGKADERHLWPVWFNLIRECRPPTIFGEQVSSAIAHGWLDDVYQGLESEGYACGSAVLPACSVGVPHKRDRLFFVGHTQHDGSHGGQVDRGHDTPIQHHTQGQNSPCKFKGASKSDDVANSTNKGFSDGGSQQNFRCKTEQEPKRLRSHDDWTTAQWVHCPDGKQRLVEPSIPLLANGISNRVGKLRGYGNAIVPAVGAAFIKATM